MDGVLQGRGHQDIHFQLQQRFVGDAPYAGGMVVFQQPAPLCTEKLHNIGHIQAVFVVDSAGNIANGYHSAAFPVQQKGSGSPHISSTLHGNCGAFQV